jgi:predicted small lipoprotein YifL
MKSLYGVSILAAALLVAGCGKKQPPSTPPSASAAADSSATNTETAASASTNADAKAESTNKETSGNPITAPVDYLGAVAKAQQVAVKQIDLAYVQKAIQLFNAQEGRNPKDLNELVSEHYLGKLPAAPFGMKLQYDATQGSVSVVKK